MKTKLILISVGALVLSACGTDKKSDSVDSDGNCKQGFIEEYNGILDASSDYGLKELQAMTTGTDADRNVSTHALSVLVSKCDSFFATRGDISCKGERRTTGAVETVLSSDHREKCDRSKVELAARKAPPKVEAPVASVDRDGHCTPAFTADFNDIPVKSYVYERARNTALITRADEDRRVFVASTEKLAAACDRLEQRHPQVTCLLEGASGSVSIAHTSDRKADCDTARTNLKRLREGTLIRF